MNDNPTSDIRHHAVTRSRGSLARWKWDALSFVVLVGLLAFFLKTSWRKWCDPIVDFGQQCYCTWRMTQGAAIFHDFVWNYGPASLYFDAGLFRVFGPGIMVLAVANLIIYAAILALGYLGFRRAWGRLGSFVALAVFISVFSFSHFLAVGNYNYATPYSMEATHGMLLILVTAFVAARWCAKSSPGLAFALGFCGGMSVVIKPEFMLATAVVGLAAYLLRWAQRQRVTALEHLLLLGGAVLPTLLFTVWFARTESLSSAFKDASNGWWVVVVDQIQRGSNQQLNFSGFNHPLANLLTEVEWTLGAFSMMAVTWAAGWFVNRNWSPLMRAITAIAAGALALFLSEKINWMDSGRCLPGVMLAALVLLVARITSGLRKGAPLEAGKVMALFLVLLGGAMLARMALYPHIFHLGFFQAALAGMVASAVMVVEVPRWTGPGNRGARVTAGVAMLVLAFGCATVAAKSLRIRADQTQSVGKGWDQFYSTSREIDGMGVLVDWASERMKSAPPQVTLLVLPEGTMINYLSRHKGLDPGWGRKTDEQSSLEAIQKNPPDYVILLTRNLKEWGIARYGAEGNYGREIIKWVADNYSVIGHVGGDPLALDDHPGVAIFERRK